MKPPYVILFTLLTLVSAGCAGFPSRRPSLVAYNLRTTPLSLSFLIGKERGSYFGAVDIVAVDYSIRVIRNDGTQYAEDIGPSNYLIFRPVSESDGVLLLRMQGAQRDVAICRLSAEAWHTIRSYTADWPAEHRDYVLDQNSLASAPPLKPRAVRKPEANPFR